VGNFNSVASGNRPILRREPFGCIRNSGAHRDLGAVLDHRNGSMGQRSIFRQGDAA
jgi:hypothetical protein